MKVREDIKKVGFSENEIFIELKSGEKKSHPLEWFPRLFNATDEQRENYTLSHFGIHWEELDEDLSFDGFFHYKKDTANEIAIFFRKFPEISMTKFAERIGISPAMLRHYACGSKTPSPSRKKEIETGLHQLGKELQQLQFA
jgi:hypothetical protein